MPPVKGLSHLLLFCLAVCGASALPAQEIETDFSERYSSDGVFHVVGTSYNAVQFTTQMAERLSRLARRYLPVPKDPPQPVLVKLVPEELADFTAPFLVRPQVNGGVHVLVRWGVDTRFEDVAQALASGLLQRTAIWHYGPEAAPKVPDWLELAFGQELIIDIRPAAIDYQRELALETPPMSIAAITTAEGPFGADLPEIAVDSGWLFRFLEVQTKTTAAFRRVCSAFLAGMNPNAILVKAYPGHFDSARELELWWAVGFEATVRGRQPPFASMEASRELITGMAFVTFQTDGADLRVAGQKLWDWHDNPEARLAMQQRVREVKIEIQKVNPVYFNSLLSLGLLYDSARGPKRDGEEAPSEEAIAEAQAVFEEALARFALDFQTAQTQELEIRRLLRW